MEKTFINKHLLFVVFFCVGISIQNICESTQKLMTHTRATHKGFQNGRTHGAGKVAIKSHFENHSKFKWIMSPGLLISDYFVILKKMWFRKNKQINGFCIFYYFLSATAWHFPEIAALCESAIFFIFFV